MVQPKFILTNHGFFRLGMVHLHKDLLLPNEQCYGGGYYEIDYTTNRLLLHGSSFDYGQPRWEWFDHLKVPAAFRGMRIVYQAAQSYDNDYVVTDELKIEYV